MAKGIAKHQNDLKDMRYPHEGDVDVNIVGYDIFNVSIRYCIVELDDMKYIILGTSIA